MAHFAFSLLKNEFCSFELKPKISLIYTVFHRHAVYVRKIANTSLLVQNPTVRSEPQQNPGENMCVLQQLNMDTALH